MIREPDVQQVLRHLPGFASGTAKLLQYNSLTGRFEWVSTASETNLSVSGWARVGSLVVPTNTTAGALTTESIFVPNQATSTWTGLINAYSNGASAPIVARLDSSSTAVGYRVQGAAVVPSFAGYRSAGTIASPSAVLLNNTLAAFDAYGFYDATHESRQAGLRFIASENWSSSAMGTSAGLNLTANGGTSLVTNHIWTTAAYTVTGSVDASAGFKVNGAATSGNVLRGDGTNFVSSTLAGTDISATYSSYTPTVTQSGTVTSFSTNVARYQQVGKRVHVYGTLIINNAGTAAGANEIRISLPVNYAFPSSAVGAAGVGSLYDASADILYPFSVRLASATVFTMLPVDQIMTGYGAGGLVLGTLRFTAALATGDVINFDFSYEAA